LLDDFELGLASPYPQSASSAQLGVAIILAALRRAPALTFALGKVFAKTVLTDMDYVAHTALP
jgi:hypothetical protein